MSEASTVILPDRLFAIGGWLTLGAQRVSWLPDEAHGARPVQCYVLSDAGQSLVIDTGLPIHRAEIDADGLLVAPGWVDIHTHYDGQATWIRCWRTDRASDPQRWRRLMKLTHEARADGVAINAQVAARQVGLILGLRTTLNPFSAKPTLMKMLQLDPEQRLRQFRDPAVRAAILSEPDSQELLAKLPPLNRAIATWFETLFVLGDPPDYEPPPERSIAALAAQANVSPAAYAYDYLTEEDGTRMLFFPGGQLQRRFERSPGDVARRGDDAGPERWRRPSRPDLRRQHADVHADALGS